MFFFFVLFNEKEAQTVRNICNSLIPVTISNFSLKEENSWTIQVRFFSRSLLGKKNLFKQKYSLLETKSC